MEKVSIMRGVAPTLLIIVLLISTSISYVYSQCSKVPPFALKGWHQSVSCLDDVEPMPPVTADNSRKISNLAYEDQYYQLGCISKGFEGYFAPSRWAVLNENGDGGVDVTGAPNSVLVEGANSASVVLSPGSSASYGIAIPATGYLTFNWSYIGGSNLIKKNFNISINGEQAAQLKKAKTSGVFSSGLLQAGDEILINASAANTGFEIRLANFEFITNAIGVYERSWTAESSGGKKATFLQYISLKKPDLTTIVFPNDYDGYHRSKIEQHSGYKPEWTGFPLFDKDGITCTTQDQHPISAARGNIEVNWQDESLYQDGVCIIYRHWTVSDLCGGNRIKHTQLIKMAGQCPETVPTRDDQIQQTSLPPVFLNSIGKEEQALLEYNELQIINSAQQIDDIFSW